MVFLPYPSAGLRETNSIKSNLPVFPPEPETKGTENTSIGICICFWYARTFFKSLSSNYHVFLVRSRRLTNLQKFDPFAMTASIGNSFITINPDELRFQFELEKQTFCDLKVLNKTEYHVAFKVKTTSPKKYFVRPNTGVIHPWDSCIIRVTLQAQQEYPPDMQCKDKFLIQSTTVSPNIDVDDLPPDTFTKDSGKLVEELKLRVVYISATSPQGSTADDTVNNSAQKLDAYSSQTLLQLKEERDATLRQTSQLQQELDMLKRRRDRRSDPGFSFTFAMFVGLIGFLFGLLLKLSLSSPPTQ